MVNSTSLVSPRLVTLGQAVSFLQLGGWDRFEEIAPWDREDAQILLMRLAAAGLVCLEGSPRWGVGPIGDRCEIHPSFFLYMVEIEYDYHMLTAIEDHPRWSHSYVEVQVCAQDLLDAVGTDQGQAPASSSIKDENDCKKWLISLMKCSPHSRTITKQAAIDEWLEMGRKISKKAFCRAWNDAMKEADASAWAAPGRPREKPFRQITTAI